MADKVGLELTTTVAPEAVVTIDGKAYRLRTHLDTAESLNMRDMSEEVRTLMELRGDARTAKDEARIDEVNTILVQICTTAPPEIAAKLPPEEQVKLLRYVTKEIKSRQDPTEADTDSAPD